LSFCLTNIFVALLCVESAVTSCCAVSLENVVADVAELEKGINATRSELEAARGCHASVSVLEDFLASAEDRMNTLNTDCKKAQVSARA